MWVSGVIDKRQESLPYFCLTCPLLSSSTAVLFSAMNMDSIDRLRHPPAFVTLRVNSPSVK